ncbi:GTPase [uncultured archaeon]|nr:GTPase [uncultured archaeon]
MNTDRIVSGVLAGEKQSIARAISVVEDPRLSPESRQIIKGIYNHTGKAHVLGITGPPGIGKSTMIGMLSKMLSQKGHSVAVLAVDASSPFTGGSLLGNRIRMQESLSKFGVYMRSLANRGLSGGLSRSVWDSVMVLDAAGFDFIIIETVGAGQADLDVVYLADTIVVVLAPGLGDQIQAIKSGIMEIADIYIVNKMDREGSYIALKDIEEFLAYSVQGEWKVPVIGTNSLTGEGYEEYISRIISHRDFTGKDSRTRLRRYRYELKLALEDEMKQKIDSEIRRLVNENAIEDMMSSRTDPYTAAESILEDLLSSDSAD